MIPFALNSRHGLAAKRGLQNVAFLAMISVVNQHAASSERTCSVLLASAATQFVNKSADKSAVIYVSGWTIGCDAIDSVKISCVVRSTFARDTTLLWRNLQI